MGGPDGRRRRWASLVATATLSAGSPAALGAGPAAAAPGAGPPDEAPAALFAYAGGGAASPSGCPHTVVVDRQCTLTQALAAVTPGGTVLLATPPGTASYVGDYALTTAATTPGAPVTVAAAPDVTGPTLDGDFRSGAPCPTAACDGPILTIGPGVHARIQGIAFTDENDTAGTAGGAIDDEGDGLVVSGSSFVEVGAPEGGAIDAHGHGPLLVTSSTFSDDGADNGGAIEVEGQSATVIGSTFSDDSAGDGGAIDVGDHGGSGSVTVVDSTFTGGGAVLGGGIGAGMHGGTATLSVAHSSFSDSGASNGAAIDDGDDGTAQVQVTGSSLWSNGAGDGGAVDSADDGGSASLVMADTSIASSAASDGGAVDNADHDGGGALILDHVTLAGNDGGFGGALESGGNGGNGTVAVVSSTIDGNGADQAVDNGGGTLSMAGTIVAGSAVDCSGPVTDAGYNLEDDAADTCGFSPAAHSLVGVDPELGPFQANGGPAYTFEPGPTSPVLDRIPEPTTVTVGWPTSLCPARDERGAAAPPAPYGCAIGAVDRADTALPIVVATSPPTGPAGASVVLHGVNLSGATSVTVGGRPAATVTDGPGGSITVTVPPGAPGPAAVVVTTPAGTSPYRPGAGYTYT